MVESVHPSIILLIVTFSIIIVISFTVLAVALIKSKSKAEPNYAQDLQIYEEQFAGRRSNFTFLFNPRLGGYRLASWPGYGSPPTPPFYGQDSPSSNGYATASPNSMKSNMNSSSASSPVLPSLLTSSEGKTPTTRSNSRFWFFGGGEVGSRSSSASSSGSGGEAIPYSESVATIQISPSRPAIFGDEKGEEGSVKFMLTPPTPAKERVFRAVLNGRRESL